jgi:SnoaL-like protein
MSDPLAIARACYDAYARKDRQQLESLLDAGYRFTSPLDNALDRATYLAICWPNSAEFETFTIVHEATAGERVFVVYEATTKSGKRFRNTELHTVRSGKLAATEVYFGWDLPHDVPKGRHRDP